ncbi:uncharacterized protein LOC142982658 [Anticarsia gemmatalis]|uniref:uncharacterized protein LOC142982658 n=1 Tax=Anticarsia gemmatalis TaxID=129554 RepID=UPI003F77450F
MFSTKINIFFYILLNTIICIQSLVKLPTTDDTSIATTEKIIRNTVNNLFAAIKIQNLNHRPKLKQFSTIHNFFVSITLTDCDNLKEISRLTRVNDVDNNTIRFIALLNEVLSDDVSNQVTDKDEHVTDYITTFIDKLKYLKQKYVTNEDKAVNADVLKYLDHDPSSKASTVLVDNIIKEDYSEENDTSEEYWRPNARRIYKGIRTRVSKFPFMASIHMFKKFQCAGSIIHNNLVITAASCLQLTWNNRFFRENPAILHVQVGSNFYEGGGDSIAVHEIYFYPTYNPKTLANNLAILRLRRKLLFRKRAHRMKMIDFDRNAWQLPDNTQKITVVGWGATDRNNLIYNPYKNKLSYADLDFYPLDECQTHYSSEFVTDKNFCAGFFSKGSGACNRDVGGPGIASGILVGVISFGSPICGGYNAPTVFTKLGYYSDWIEQIKELNLTYTLKKTTTPAPGTSFSHIYEVPTTTIRLTPISGKGQTPGSILDLDLLRIAQDEDFRDFMLSMFGSEELSKYMSKAHTKKDYVPKKKVRQGEVEEVEEEVETEFTGQIAEPTEMPNVHEKVVTSPDTVEEITTVTQPTQAEISEGTEPAEAAEAIEPAEAAEATEATEATENAETTKPTKATKAKKQTKQSKNNINPINKSNDVIDKTLEEDIMKLINTLDVDLLLPYKPEDEDTSEEELDNNKTNSTNTTGGKIEKATVGPNDEHILNFLFETEEDDDDDDIGLSIPEETKPPALREMPVDNNNQRTLSEKSLYDLIALALDEEVKRFKNT